jgi:ribonucleoside-diphosphate reductase beta chain
MVGWIATDESRHIAYGTYLISRLVAEHGEAMYDTFMSILNELTPLAMGVVQYGAERYGTSSILNIDPAIYMEYASRMLNLRMSVIERARKMSPKQIYYMHIRELEVAEEAPS